MSLGLKPARKQMQPQRRSAKLRTMSPRVALLKKELLSRNNDPGARGVQMVRQLLIHHLLKLKMKMKILRINLYKLLKI
jgi:hypothetical protein